MKIDRELVETVADLAKLKMDDTDVDATIDRMTKILDLVEEMQALDTDGVEPLAHPLDAVQRLRPDEVTDTNQREKYQAVAPETADGLYLVPRVVE
jgi:aspartyl-tRNA(Asn)/glutamyl-tRNA(Gln) amidotransferase subunit C